MKSLFILLPFLATPLSFYQNSIRCLYSDTHTVFNETGLIKKNTPACACFDNTYFAYYRKEVGSRVFRREHITKSLTTDGYPREMFVNGESETVPEGDLSFQIDYGPTISIMINYSKHGQAVLIQGKEFIGTTNPFIKEHINIPGL
jgi:hypothetical protein